MVVETVKVGNNVLFAVFPSHLNKDKVRLVECIFCKSLKELEELKRGNNVF